MITHELLPLDPSDGDMFEIPKGIQIHLAAFIHLVDAETKVHLGEASSIDKMRNCAHGWVLNRVYTHYSLGSEQRKVDIQTALFNASHLQFKDRLGWVVAGYETEPSQVINYTGTLMCGSHSVYHSETLYVYDHLQFQADKKGETK
jgi:predicted transcriptional regulator YheO